jgi:hypothetical protein
MIQLPVALDNIRSISQSATRKTYMSAHDSAVAIGFIDHSQMSSPPLIYNHAESMKREYIKTLRHKIIVEKEKPFKTW